MSFKIEAVDNKTQARAGIFKTAHGIFHTPAFMPVATKGTVKTVSVDELERMGTEVIIANALHLHIRPGEQRMKRAGGLHKFMCWNRPIFTDSGGFQIIRKNFNIKITDSGLNFKDFLSGTPRLYTPELCMNVQHAIGSDIAMLLDDCPRHDAKKRKVVESIERTIGWAKRGIEHGRKLGIPHIFVIVQGGTDLSLRQWCTEALIQFKPEGYAIGGLSIGESKEDMMKILELSIPHLPQEKPRYLMGVGSSQELLNAIALGVDIFDSTFPTQCARHGTLFSSQGRYNLKGLEGKKEDVPLDEACGCEVCAKYSRFYIHHLLKEKEMLGMRLASIHNLYFILNLVRQARSAILNGTFDSFRKQLIQPQEKNKKLEISK